MKVWLIQFLLLLVHGVALAAKFPPANTNDFAIARSQGSNSLASLKALITPANYQLLGFHSAEEVLQATNAEPVAIRAVVMDNLQHYLPEMSFETLLEQEPRQVIIPIKVGTKVRSSTTLRIQPQSPGQPANWVTANWGQPRLIRNLMETHRSIPDAEVMPGSVPFAVEIPVFDIWLIGYYNSRAQLVMRSTVDLHLGPITINRHEFVTEAAMHRLAIVAQRYNGLPN